MLTDKNGRCRDDIEITIHAVAIPKRRDSVRVKSFDAMTCDLEGIVEWLKHCGIDTVAMESTGIYWKALFRLLIAHEFEVYLVNTKEVKNVSGRKTDEDDALWIQNLHSCGLLKTCYLSGNEQETLRTLVRYRKSLVEDMGRFILRLQKSFEAMNIKIHSVISDIMGATGRRIIENILAGERNPENLLGYIDKRIKANSETIMKSFQGKWRDEHFFIIEKGYKFYNVYQERVVACDLQIERQLNVLQLLNNEGLLDTGNQEWKSIKKKSKNHPDIIFADF
jgi:hypothetical protein